MNSTLFEKVFPDYRGSETEYGLYVTEKDGCIGIAIWPAEKKFDRSSTLKHFLMMGTDEVRDLIAALENGLRSAEAMGGKKRLGR